MVVMSASITVRFAASIAETARADLLQRIGSVSAPAELKTGFDLGNRAPEPAVAEPVAAVHVTEDALQLHIAEISLKARAWLLQFDTPGTYIEVIDERRRLTFRLAASDAAEAIAALDAVLTNSAASDPLSWNGQAWVPEPTGTTGPPRILVLATEWFSAHGGLSTFNRRLCVALARMAKVYCVVLDASEAERADADKRGVRLLIALRIHGASQQEALSRRPALPTGVAPHLIIGHGRITGRAADAVAQDHFAGVPRLHILHMAPDEVEWWKPGDGNDRGLSAEERMEQERALLRPPAIGAGVGPRLYDLVQAEVCIAPQAAEPLRIDPGFDVDSDKAENPRSTRTPPRGRPVRILMLGRMEDRWVKGIDLAAESLGEATDMLGVDPSTLEMVLRGVPENEFAATRDAVHEWSGKQSLRVAPRKFMTDPVKLDEDLLRATLVLMPSRAEGFGLVGLEAIVSGTPVLVSGVSGLGELLREVLPPDEAQRIIVPVTSRPGEDRRRWAAAIAAILRDPKAAFDVARRVQEIMIKERTWEMAADAVLRLVR
jgi:glycosyltransferase involved in cell wall biosynthesis